MLKGKTCLVTGASRGIGRGIALALGEAGATVYVTGRKAEASASEGGRSLEETARELSEKGGKGVAVHCDHSKDDEVRRLFELIAADTEGCLDVLVNCAFAGIPALIDQWGQRFWETEVGFWDAFCDVGLRGAYVASVHAARLMVQKGRGLIVNVSSLGGLQYLFNVPYGVGKAALDRMSADTAHELQPHNVTVVSLWPGAVKTEMFGGRMTELGKGERAAEGTAAGGTGYSAAEVAETLSDGGESPEFVGKCVVALAAEPAKARKRTGKILMTADLADEFGLRDAEGKKPGNFRSLKYVLRYKYRKAGLARLVPACLKVPKCLLAIDSSNL